MKVQNHKIFKLQSWNINKFVISRSSVLGYYQSNVPEDKCSWKVSTTENVYQMTSVKHELNYQCWNENG